MFNGDLKREALERLKNSNSTYQNAAKTTAAKAERLYALRKTTSENVILKAQDYVNVLANSPKEFNKAVSELKVSFSSFNAKCYEILRADNVATVSGSTAGTGIALGAGVAAFGPSAAMAIATTFGTASTGTAISALSGAAATNAGLAWLGGGALAAGGGGMAAGNALLALAGPVGWTIGGVALVGAGWYARTKNTRIAEEATQKAGEIEERTMVLKTTSRGIDEIANLTQEHVDGALAQLQILGSDAPNNYSRFTDSQKQELGALVNNINSLSKLLNKELKT